MPIDPSIPLGYRAPAYIDPQRIRLAQQEHEQNQQASAVRQLQLEKLGQDAADDKNFREAVGRGATAAELMKIAPVRAIAHQKALSEQRKSDVDFQKEKLNFADLQAKIFGKVASTVVDTPTLVRGAAQLRELGLIDQATHDTVVQSGFTDEVAGFLKQHIQSALDVQQQLEEARKVLDDQYKASEEGRKASKEERESKEFTAKLPGVQAETESKQLTTAGQSVGGVNNQAAYDQWRAGLPPEVQKRIPVMYSPAAVNIVSRMALTAQQRATADQAAANATETGRHNLKAEENTVRGQNMTDSRSRELATLRKENKPPSAAEQRVYGFYTRAKDAADTLDQMQDSMVKKGLAAQGWQKWGPNWLQSDENQVYSQAQRQFTEARLRKDSGAAIAPGEYENDRITYFPQPGDGPKVLARKAAARKALLESLHRESGRAAAVHDGAPVADAFGELGFEEGK
jgi:hypothetical protein